MIEGRKAQCITVDGQELIIFSSNDYFGFSHHPDVLKASAEAAERFGCGTGGAPGTSGTTAIHRQLADNIARFKHRDLAIIFSSGYAANVGLHQSLANDDTIFFSDEKNHPSAADGLKLSGCDKRVFKHRDYDHLEGLLKKDSHTRKAVTTCSVFTLDGAICDLDRLARLKEKYGFILIIDEAHATGCLGKTGRGLEEHYNLTGITDYIMGTFSKALGSQGGFITYSKDADKLLSKPLRPFEYSTSIAAPAAAASLKALQILESNVELIVKMKANIKMIYDYLNANGFQLNTSGKHIVNVYFESHKKTMQVVEGLHRNGYFVVPINLDGRWGLRLTAMAVHTDKQIHDFCNKLSGMETFNK
ncbi:MAG: pyridoxal phosphate-dependent aminotransferase family protein [candidate division Zixibacteria bacterium]|nr:pyridoxal phosphate-dependent aminotransferase family protein [candidate division Zixibacteria bacterium]